MQNFIIYDIFTLINSKFFQNVIQLSFHRKQLISNYCNSIYIKMIKTKTCMYEGLDRRGFGGGGEGGGGRNKNC